MDFKMYICTYILILMHVLMDSIEGRDNGHADEMRPENARLLDIAHLSHFEHHFASLLESLNLSTFISSEAKNHNFEEEPEQKHDMMVGMQRLIPEQDDSSTANSDSGLKVVRQSGIDEAHPKEISRVIMLPSKLQSIRQSEYPTLFPVMRFNYLRTSMNKERDILSSTNDIYRPKGIVIKRYLKRTNLNGNMKPTGRSASMIGYLGDTSKVEQQLTMASGLVSEESPMIRSLIGKSYSSYKANHLANLIRNLMASKHNGRDQQASVDHGSRFRYTVQENEKNSDSNSHIMHLKVVPQKKVINLSGLFPRDESYLERREKIPSRSYDGVSNMEKVRSRRSIERNPRLLGHVNVAVNKGRTKRASIDLTNLLPPITLEIGRTARKSDDSESTEDTSENERSGLSMDKTRSKRSTEKLSRLLGSVDVTVNKGRSKRASIDLDNLLPAVSLEIGKSAKSGSKANKMGRRRRASVDLSGILPTTNLQVGKSERSIPDSEQSRFSPRLILSSDTKQDRASVDDAYLHSMIRYFLKNLAKCDELTDDDYDDFSRQ